MSAISLSTKELSRQMALCKGVEEGVRVSLSTYKQCAFGMWFWHLADDEWGENEKKDWVKEVSQKRKWRLFFLQLRSCRWSR